MADKADEQLTVHTTSRALCMCVCVCDEWDVGAVPVATRHAVRNRIGPGKKSRKMIMRNLLRIVSVLYIIYHLIVYHFINVLRTDRWRIGI